jgi:hypothetical protein
VSPHAGSFSFFFPLEADEAPKHCRDGQTNQNTDGVLRVAKPKEKVIFQ